MNEVVKRVHQYRGYKITYVSKQGVWIINSSTGVQWGTTFETPKEAKDYIDDILREDDKLAKVKKSPQVINTELDGEQDRSRLNLED